MKFIIFGSCVTRDVFEFVDKDKTELVRYFARSSLGSAYSNTKVENIDISSIESNFQKSIVASDLNKEFPDFLANSEFDYIIYDAIDERFKLLVMQNGSLCTLSNELQQTKNYKQFVKREILSASDEFFTYWEKGWSSLIGQLDAFGKRSSLLINKAFWAKRTISGDNFLPSYTDNGIDKANAFLAKLYERMAQDIPKNQFIEFNDSLLIGSDNHKWGKSPFHYVDEYYKYFVKIINKYINKEITMYFFGVTRFSVYLPDSKAWHLSQVSEQEYLDRLFSDERLASRFDIFINKALPIYQEMSKKYNYRHIIHYSNLLPEKWKKVLIETASKNSVLYLDEVYDKMEYATIMKNLLDTKESGVTVFFRVDDDDLLSIDYLDKLSAYARPEFVGMAVSFGSGIASIYSNGRFTEFKKIRKPLLSQGQAYIGDYNTLDKKLIFPKQGTHTQTDMHTPTILDSRFLAFVCTHHESQDSYQKKPSVSQDIIKKLYSNYEQISNISDVYKSFPTLKNDVRYYITDDGFDFTEHMQIKDDTHNFIVNPILFGRYEFELRLSSDSIYNLKGAIASFEFNKEPNLLEGLLKSQVKDIGWFHYLKTAKDGVVTKFVIDIPQGIELNKLKIIPWSVKSVPIFLDDIKITKQHDKISLSVSTDDNKIYASIVPFQNEDYAFYVVRNDEVIYRQMYTSKNSFEYTHNKISGKYQIIGYARSKDGLVGIEYSRNMFVSGQKCSLENISKNKLKDTYLLVKSGHYSFYCLYFEGKTDNLFVLLSGAIDRDKMNPPFFTRWAWRDKFPGHVLCISDPTLLANETINLGWYIGSEEHNATNDMAELVKHIAKILDIPNKRIISYGSSGGGFGALMLASKIEGSLAVAINAQTNTLNYWSNSSMVNTCFPNRSKEFIEENYGDRICAQKALKNSNSRVLIVQNTLDEHHWRVHYPPFAKEMGLPMASGISKDGKHRAIIYDDPRGHVAETPEIFAEIMRNVDEMLNDDTKTQ
jgi:hypothetical protein